MSIKRSCNAAVMALRRFYFRLFPINERVSILPVIYITTVCSFPWIRGDYAIGGRNVVIASCHHGDVVNKQ